MQPAAPYDCQQCIGRHAVRHGFPVLPPECVLGWGLYFRVQHQLRMGLEPIALDIAAVVHALNLYGIDDRHDRRFAAEVMQIADQVALALAQEKRAAQQQQKPSRSSGRARPWR